MSRCETGPVEFRNDWPGVFIRGDNSLNFAMYVEEAVKVIEAAENLHIPTPALLTMYLKDLHSLLASVNAYSQNKNLTKLNEFDECKLEE